MKKKVSKFIKDICKECGSENILFEKSTTKIKCSCGVIQTLPSSGKCKLVNCTLKEVLR